jgi:hypothetical protein
VTPHHPQAVATLLEAAADRIDASPGTNALDAMRAANPHPPGTGARSDTTARDQLAADAYYALLEYLPMHVDLIGPWSDTETPDRVAQKLRQCARTIRKGGPARIEDQPPPPAAAPADVVLADGATHRTHGRRRNYTYTPEGRLRASRGHTVSALTRQQKSRHPDPRRITELELQLVDIDRQLAELEGDAEPSRAGLVLVGAGA